ncbi:hypothetical protein SAMN04488061_3347 [Filomicrobium insigne]|uniref:Uncharacterized protein n=1 Tax=Filomicrobium insigne TaxID=418854 RepID=A0A1H0TSR0_9HYPH|nr:hypothetical protein SAMN04488061_3347 [Filomicrobium insigne]
MAVSHFDGGRLQSFVRYFVIFVLCLLVAPQIASADCVSPVGEEGVLLYNPPHKVMQFCDGEKWISAAGGISQKHLSPGVSPWKNMDLTDTADFDGACEYRFDIGSGWAYAHTVHPDYLLFDASTAGWKFGAIEKGAKDQYWHRDDGNVAATGGTPMPIAAMQKSCMIDAEPDAITFVDVADAAPDTQITSNAVTLSGFNSEVFVTISGDGAPELSIDGGPWVTSGIVTNGQTVQLRLTSDSGFEAARTATVILGGANYSWSVTTGPEPGDCASITINWSPGCSASSGNMIHGATKSVNNSASGYSGTRDLSCDDGTISQSGGSCTATGGTWKSLAPDYSWNGCGSSVPTPGTPCSPIGKKCTGHNGSTVRSFRCQ